jgi:hypothetical protein
VADGTGDVAVTGGYGVYTVGTFSQGGSSTVSPEPGYTSYEELFPVPTPVCSGPDRGKVRVNAGETAELEPGSYEQININSGDLTMKPGMYCIYGTKGFTGTGGTVLGEDIFIYVEQGPFDLGGSTHVELKAADSFGEIVDDDDNDWQGMLVFAAFGNTSSIKITGDTDTIYTGTIFAPSSLCTLEGGGETMGIDAQVICDQVKITGSAYINIDYEEGENFRLPPAIDLAR